MPIRLRFAPSPTGFLHIGGARTALFNYLYARHHGGSYLLRIEDTDKERSTKQAIDAIMDGLEWLGLSGDEPPCFQSENIERHQAVAHELLAAGKAYRCYASKQELDEMREKAKEEGRPALYDGRWRDKSEADYPKDQSFTIRIKMPRDGQKTTLNDLVQGEVTIAHDQLDDFILLRADGTPTYMLSVVVDDHDMGITHIVRGDDHLTNAFRQAHLFKAAGWDVPQFAHIPLIHGADGAKLSKRHGALGVEQYREMGYLPEAIKNYLLRLGWSHGDEEIISEQQAIDWFDMDAIGRSAARFDVAKLDHLNAHYLREGEPSRILNLLYDRLGDNAQSPNIKERLAVGLDGLRQRTARLDQLAGQAMIYVLPPDYSQANEKTQRFLNSALPLLPQAISLLETIEPWDEPTLNHQLRILAEQLELGFGKLAQPLRASLTGLEQSPGLFEVILVLGKEETLNRLQAAQSWLNNG